MSQKAMQGIIILLLVVIIVLLAICIVLDIRLEGLTLSHGSTSATTSARTTAAPPASTTPLSTTAPSTAPPTPLSSSLPLTTTLSPMTTVPHTTVVPSVSSTLPVTTQTPLSTQTPITTAPITTPVATTPSPATTPTPVTTARPYDPSAPTICIDPGHGFEDPGAIDASGTVYEREINMQISLKLKAELEAHGYNVILTHDGVTLPDKAYLDSSSPRYNVTKRRQWIEDHIDEIDLVISIHCNSSRSSSSKGSGYYIYTSHSDYNSRSYTLMNYLIRSVVEGLSLSRDPYWYDQTLGVLKTSLPSVLVECGFITNASDLANLKSEAWQSRFAQALADGIADYCRIYVK